jgi:hypothetical protein
MLAGLVVFPLALSVAFAPSAADAYPLGALAPAAVSSVPATHGGHTGHSGHHSRHHRRAHHHRHARHHRGRRFLMPPRPHHVRVVRVTSSAFTVRFSGHARRFRLFAAPRKRQLAVVAIHHHARRSRLYRHPVLTLRHLRNSGRPLYYRIEAKNGPRRRYSPIRGTISLRPATPTGVGVSSSSAGLSMSWHGGGATGYTITQSTSPDMSQGVTTYTTNGPEQQFTPYGLNRGATYYFTIAADNGNSQSPPSPVVSGASQVEQLPVRMMTYNVLRSDGDGRIENGNVVAPWAQRAPGVVARIQAADPDVVAIEEGGGWVGAVRGPRQADDLVSRLGGEYALANTETAPNLPHYFRTGVYLLYKTSEFTPIGTPGHWALGDTRWAAYQALQSRSTGARFVAVCAHLLVGPSALNDRRRAAETASLLRQSQAYAASLGGLPVIYGGDWNSDATRRHTSDTVRETMRAAGVADALDVAQSRSNENYNSANGYLRTPPTGGADIDAIFAPAGVGVSSWGMEMLLNGGKFDGVIPSDHNAVYADLLVPYTSGVLPSPPPSGSTGSGG